MLVALTFVSSNVVVAAQAAGSGPASPEGQLASQVHELASRLEDTRESLKDTRESNRANDTMILTPMAILIGILAAGGALGIVFSVRDQRRTSQLHALSVSAEVGTQRRIEESYSTFLGESQKTLTLVNDTLGLAKEATDREARSMDLKAKSNLDALEAEAEDLVLQVIETGDYEEIVDLPEPRSRVQSIARRLASLEGYVVLQDIDLHPYSRLVKGIEQFLDGSITAALHTLRHAAQDSSNRQLQRFSLYWAAKLNNAVGSYDHALHLLDQALELFGTQESIEKQEMRRLHLETEFFQISEEVASATETPLGAIDRFKSVKRTLVDLADVSQRIQRMTAHDKDKHAHHEVAINLADIYSWIAYRPWALCSQLDGTAREDAEAVVRKVNQEVAEELVAKKIFEERVADGRVEEKVAEEIAHTAQNDLTASLDDEQLTRVLRLNEEAFRAWVMLQAKRVFPKIEDLHSDEGVDFSLIFGRAECDFALGDSHDVEEYKALEGKALEDQVGGHREHRWAVELAQIALISKVRLLRHAEVDRQHADVDKLLGEVDSTYIRLQNALHGAPDHNVNIFSHLQRRNLDENSFREEATSLKDQAKEGLPEYVSDEPSGRKHQAPGEGA